MSKMSELAAELSELKRCGEILIGISETLTKMFSSDCKEEKQESAKEQKVNQKTVLTITDVRKVLAENHARVILQRSKNFLLNTELINCQKLTRQNMLIYFPMRR